PSDLLSTKTKHALLDPQGWSIFSRLALHDNPTIPRPIALQKPCSYRHEKAETLPHFTASSLALAASILPFPRTFPIPVSSACASFASIRTNVSVIRPLRTLSTHRMVRSTNPLSNRERVLYQRRRLKPRVFRSTRTPRVIGSSSNFLERTPGPISRFSREPTFRITL